MRRHRSLSTTFAALAAVVALFGTVTACTNDEKSTPKTDATDDTTGGTGSTDNGNGNGNNDPFDWQEFGDSGRVHTGHLEVPIDYDDPSLGTFDLFVARHMADPDKRIGSLLVNPGGPGYGGSDFAIYAEQIYNDPLLERFDIIGWDPRGTGLTEPAIDCVDDYDRYFAENDITPETDAERQQIIDRAEEFAEACVEANSSILQHIGTNDSARDMNAIREALGEDTISYFGFSYGSELGATWVTLFPDTVRAAVLDGAVDPNADYIDQGLQQAKGFEQALTTFLAQCSNDSSCAFHSDGDAEGAFDELMQQLDENPVPSAPGRPDVGLLVAINGVAEAMYSDEKWDELATALADARDGDGRGLLALHDSYFSRNPDGTYDNSLEAFQAIYCMDTAERLTVEEDDATVEAMQEAAPRISPGTTGSYFCTFFPKSDDPRIVITGKGAGPILVMGTTGDASTPLAGTKAMADTLEDGRLVVVDANQHTGYWVSDCSGSTIDQYLIDPVANAPADGTRCD